MRTEKNKWRVAQINALTHEIRVTEMRGNDFRAAWLHMQRAIRLVMLRLFCRRWRSVL